MEQRPDHVVARVPIVVRCLDAHGRPVSLSPSTLGRGSIALQDLLRRAYSCVRGDVPSETVTVAFHENCPGSLRLEYLVVDRTPPSRWRKRRERRRAKEAEAALMEATLVVTVSVEMVGSLAEATTARWTDSDDDAFSNVVLDGSRTVRVPSAVRAGLSDDSQLDLLRDTLSMFAEDGVQELIIGKDPETPGRYQETVVTRSSDLVGFVGGAPLASLTSGEHETS